MIRDFFQKREHPLEQVCFEYLGVRRRGRGLLSWDPAVGFRLDAFLDRLATKPRDLRPWGLRVLRKEDMCVIRMTLSKRERAFAPDVVLLHRDDIEREDRLSVYVDRVIFSSGPAFFDKGFWSGSALFEIGERNSIRWPDRVEKAESLNRRKIIVEGAGGLRYRDRWVQLMGRPFDDRRFEISWALARSKHSRRDAWLWPEAMREALSVLLGRSVCLLYRDLHGSHLREEFRKSGEVRHLSPFHLVDPHSDFDKKRFVAVTRLFLRDGPQARVCRRTFAHVLEAARLASPSTSELLMSITLEGILRAVDATPTTVRHWEVGRSLSTLRKKYLNPDWRKACKRAAANFDALRHRRAHPGDWSVDDRIPPDPKATGEAVVQMMFLSRFYGYVILAMAGVKGIEPSFVNGEWLGPPKG